MNPILLKRFLTIFNTESQRKLKEEQEAVREFETILFPLLKEFENDKNLVIFDRIDEVKTLTSAFYHWIQGLSFNSAQFQKNKKYTEIYTSTFKTIQYSRPNWLSVSSPQKKQKSVTMPGFLISWFHQPELQLLSLEEWQTGILQEIQALDLALSNPLAFQKKIQNQEIIFINQLGIHSKFGIIKAEKHYPYENEESYFYYTFWEDRIHSIHEIQPKTFYPQLFYVDPFCLETEKQDVFDLKINDIKTKKRKRI